MSGPDAVAHLQSMVSNDVEAIPSGGGAYALLLTPKARVISDLEVFNTPAGLVLACPPETRDDVVDVLVRARFLKKVEQQGKDTLKQGTDRIKEQIRREAAPAKP